MNRYEDEQQYSVPPHSISAEQSVLGGIMLADDAFGKVKGLLSPEDFYHGDHKLYYDAICDLASEDKPLDFLVVADHLDKLGKSDNDTFSYLGDIAKNTPSAANIVAYAGIVKEKSILRSLISIGCEIQTSAHAAGEESARDKAIAAQDAVIRLVQDNRETKSRMTRPKQMIKSILDDWERCNNGESLLGLKTGFSQLDKVTQGLGAAWFVVVAGRPKMGKTAFAMALEQSIMGAQNKPLGIISMEMPEKELMQRHVSFMSGVPLSLIRSGEVVKDETGEMIWKTTDQFDFTEAKSARLW